MFVRLELALLQHLPQRLVIEPLACSPRDVTAKDFRQWSRAPSINGAISVSAAYTAAISARGGDGSRSRSNANSLTRDRRENRAISPPWPSNMARDFLT